MNEAAPDNESPLSTNELLQSSANPLDTPDSTVRPSKEAIEDEVQVLLATGFRNFVLRTRI